MFLLLAAANAFGTSFLPVLARSQWAGDAAALYWLPGDVAAGLPVSAFWLAVAAAQLSTGLWERGRNHRVLMLVFAGLATVGLALAGLADHVLALTVWRAVGGFGFGAVMILVQDALIRAMGPQARTQASGLYLSLFFGGTIFGTLAGGWLAGAVGAPATLLLAAGLSAAATIFGSRVPHHREAATATGGLSPAEILGNRRLVALVLFAAVPSRVLNTGLAFYIVPLYLHDLGVAQGTTGWVVASYSLILATTTGFWSRIIDRNGRPLSFVVSGALLSALAALVIPLGWSGLWGAVAAVALLGVAQSVGMAPQVTVLFQVAAAEMERCGRTRLLGFYRVCERLGLFLGPLLTALLVGQLGYERSLAILAGVVGIAGGVLALSFRGGRTAAPMGERTA